VCSVLCEVCILLEVRCMVQDVGCRVQCVVCSVTGTVPSRVTQLCFRASRDGTCNGEGVSGSKSRLVFGVWCLTLGVWYVVFGV